MSSLLQKRTPLLDFNNLGRRYHRARAAAATLAMVFFGALGLFWDWPGGLDKGESIFELTLPSVN